MSYKVSEIDGFEAIKTETDKKIYIKKYAFKEKDKEMFPNKKAYNKWKLEVFDRIHTTLIKELIGETSFEVKENSDGTYDFILHI